MLTLSLRSCRRVAGLLLLAVLAAGCADADQGGAMPEAGSTPSPSGPGAPQSPVPPRDGTSPPMSSTDLPTLPRPPKPPKTPSDLLRHDLVAGRVTKGGTGPCYGLVTQDGVEYAMHSTAGIELTEGSLVRVRFEPLKLKIYCGPGRHISILDVTEY